MKEEERARETTFENTRRFATFNAGIDGSLALGIRQGAICTPPHGHTSHIGERCECREFRESILRIAFLTASSHSWVGLDSVNL